MAKNPDYILTTYGHYYDELFKIYCAKNLMKIQSFLFFNGDGGIYADDNDLTILLA